MSEVPEETGDERVDAIVADLGRLGELPVSEHVAVFDEAFSGLEGALAAVEGTTGDDNSASRDREVPGQGGSARGESAQDEATQVVGRR